MMHEPGTWAPDWGQHVYHNAAIRIMRAEWAMRGSVPRDQAPAAPPREQWVRDEYVLMKAEPLARQLIWC